MLFDENGDIWLRQSWLDTAFRCLERGRFATIKPEWDAKSSDSAIIGTGAHAGFECKINSLNGLAGDPEAAIRAAIAAEVANGVKWTKYATHADLIDNALRCYDAWEEGILPEIMATDLHVGARTEVGFKVPLFKHTDGRTVGITGTIDFVPQRNVLWDWKTSSQKFRAAEKQKHAIQATVYTLAAIKGGLATGENDDVEYSWPMTFVYGIAVRGEKKAIPQILAVRRTEEHALFAISRMKDLVNLALDYGTDRNWPKDDDHFLCSQTWCPWWSICKGAHNVSNEQPVGFSH